MKNSKLEVLINLFKSGQQIKDKDLVSQLILNGFTDTEAEKYIIFLPIAFGRTYLRNRYNNLEFNDFYYHKTNLKKVLLLDDKIYIWATNLSEKNYTKKFLEDKEYLSILTRSPEIKNILEAIRLKEDIDGAKFRTVINIGFSHEGGSV